MLAHAKGKFVDVLKKHADGSWKIVYDIWNADAAPPALSVPTGPTARQPSRKRTRPPRGSPWPAIR